MWCVQSICVILNSHLRAHHAIPAEAHHNSQAVPHGSNGGTVGRLDSQPVSFGVRYFAHHRFTKCTANALILVLDQRSINRNNRRPDFMYQLAHTAITGYSVCGARWYPSKNNGEHHRASNTKSFEYTAGN